MRVRHYLLILLLPFLMGIRPFACVTQPYLQDYLTTGNSVVVNGLAVDLDNLNDPQRLPLATEELSYQYTFLGENLGFDGSTQNGVTQTDSSGAFSIPLDLHQPGLYLLRFGNEIPSHPSYQLITSRPELAAKPEQKVYFDWHAGEQFLDAESPHFAMKKLIQIVELTLAVEQRSLDRSEIATLFKIETERIFERNFAFHRVVRVETPAEATEIINVYGCYLPDSEGGCLDELYGYGGYFRNTGVIRIFLHPIQKFIFGQRNWAWGDYSYLDPQEAVEIRGSDVGRTIGNIASHEFGHFLGLVADNLHGTQRGTPGGAHHNPIEPEEIASRRQGYGWFMMDSGTFSQLNQYFEDDSGVPRARRTPPGQIVRRIKKFNELNTQFLNIVQ